MTLSSLVLTLRGDDQELRGQALAQLAADPRLTLGEELAGRLPLVLETSSAREGELATEALLELPGVSFVDVVCVCFDDEEPE